MASKSKWCPACGYNRTTAAMHFRVCVVKRDWPEWMRVPKKAGPVPVADAPAPPPAVKPQRRIGGGKTNNGPPKRDRNAITMHPCSLDGCQFIATNMSGLSRHRATSKVHRVAPIVVEV